MYLYTRDRWLYAQRHLSTHSYFLAHTNFVSSIIFLIHYYFNNFYLDTNSDIFLLTQQMMVYAKHDIDS